ncbi:MAG: NifB/NifX family molybdenum-iron cluster-binding protein [Trichlorobacter sp.]|jgi:predicted Fe-Mo cluster-binding NifX family protein
MRTAFSLWNERIAPVFDVARHLWIVDAEDGRIIGQTGRRFSSDDPQERALRLTTLQIEQLVCGAITRSSYEALVERGIRVVSFIAGDLNQVVHAWLADRLKEGELNMPGCNRGKRHGARRYPGRDACVMTSKRTRE